MNNTAPSPALTDPRANALGLFAGLAPAVTHELLAAARLTEITKGDHLARAGEVAMRFCILLDGWACVRKGNAEGQESILHILTAGDVFTAPEKTGLSFIGEDIVALSKVTILSLPMSLAQEISHNCPPFAANLMTAMSQRAQTLLDHIEHLTLRDAEQRVGWFLLRVRLLTSPESVVTGDVEIKLPFEKTVIASYLNIKPETLSRILHQLRDRGFCMQRNKIAMPEAQALCGYCDARAAQICPYGDTTHCPHPVADTIEPI